MGDDSSSGPARGETLDFNEQSETSDLEPEEEAMGPPDFRATITRGKVTVINWAPYLLRAGPHGQLLRERARAGVTIADLWMTGVPQETWVEGNELHELIVEYLSVANRRHADRALTRWAEAVGYTRLWLPDRLVALDFDHPLGLAHVECSNCGAKWEDSSPDFWAGVRACGRFPSVCQICNGDLPQWAQSSSAGRPGRKK
jgi:hypothetical protein